jgi:hypothetical protein
MSMYTATLPGRNLAIKFQSLGNVIGKTLDEIVAVVGPPNARAGMAQNKMLFQWHATGYHVAILFDDNLRVIKITSEHINIQEPDANDIASGIGSLIAIAVVILLVVVAVVSHH